MEHKIAVKAGQVNAKERHEKGKSSKKLHSGPGQVQKVICCSAIIVLNMSQNAPLMALGLEPRHIQSSPEDLVTVMRLGALRV